MFHVELMTEDSKVDDGEDDAAEGVEGEAVETELEGGVVASLTVIFEEEVAEGEEEDAGEGGY